MEKLEQQPREGGEPSNEHELLVGGIVRAALELAILRGDLRMDNGASFEEMSESEREDVITDTWNAMNGEGTCDDKPVKELTAIYAALRAAGQQEPQCPLHGKTLAFCIDCRSQFEYVTRKNDEFHVRAGQQEQPRASALEERCKQEREHASIRGGDDFDEQEPPGGKSE